MKKIIYLLVALFAIPFIAKAQETNVVPSITINMTVDTLVAPDLFKLSIIIVDNKGIGKKGIDKAEGTILIPALKSLKIDVKRDLVISDVYSTYSNKGKDVMSKRYILTLYSKEICSKAIEKLKSEDIVVSLQSSEVSNRKEIMSELRIRAMKESKKEAQMLLEAVGDELGSLLNVSVRIYSPLRNDVVVVSGISSRAKSYETVDNYKNVSLSANIDVKYRIKE